MTTMQKNVEKCTPKVEELLPSYVNTITCSVTDCTQIFHNWGQYNMHLVRHHKIDAPPTAETKIYYCPVERCIYHIEREDGRYMQNMWLLRQHYRKVHMEKAFICEACGKRFCQAIELQRHQSNGSCGQEWKCADCGWKYSSREGLQTHVRRKGHNYDTKNVAVAQELKRKPNFKNKKVIKETCTVQPNKPNTFNFKTQTPVRSTLNNLAILAIGTEHCNMETQTEQTHIPGLKNLEEEIKILNRECNLKRKKYAKTEVHGNKNIKNEKNSPPCDIETQTENNINAIFEPNHMSTQTTFNLWKQLELTNIETQTTSFEDISIQNNEFVPETTNSSYLAENILQDFVVSTQTQTSILDTQVDLVQSKVKREVRDAWTESPTHFMNWSTNCLRVDDFLVSTETQTSYEQCLLDTELRLANIETQTYNSNSNQRNEPNLNVKKSSNTCEDFLVSTETQTTFAHCLLGTDGLYTTQHTQTSDELINELFFGDQENFQSTYTQT